MGFNPLLDLHNAPSIGVVSVCGLQLTSMDEAWSENSGAPEEAWFGYTSGPDCS